MTVDQVEQLVKRLIDRARDAGVTSIEEGAQDLYWCVGAGDWLNMEETPEVVVGSVAEDCASALRGSELGVVSSLDFDRLASVLRYLGFLVEEADGIW